MNSVIFKQNGKETKESPQPNNIYRNNSIIDLKYTPSTISALAFVSFGQKKQQINLESRKFSKEDKFPDYKKVPNGFKYIGTKSLVNEYSINKKGSLESCYTEPEQVTVVDRNNDENFQKIKQDYDEKAKVWLNFIKDNKLTKQQRDKFLIFNTLEYIRLLKQNKTICTPINTTNNKQNENEQLLGDVFAEKSNVCRHNSFLAKLLLEDYNVPLGIQAGYIISPIGSGNHCWNSYTEKNGKQRPFDASFINGDCWYFGFDGKPMYSDNLPKETQPIFDILNMQVGDTLLIGHDKNNNIITSKCINSSNDYFAKLHLSAFDDMKISSPQEVDNGEYDYNVDEKGNVFIYNTESKKNLIQFSYNELVYFLKLRVNANCIKLSKELNIPFIDGKPNYKEIFKHKELFTQLDNTLSKQTIDSMPDILELEDYDN